MTIDEVIEFLAKESQREIFSQPYREKLKAALGAVTAVREDKLRLDLLDRNALARDRTLAVMERGADHEPIRWAGIEWDGRETPIRAAVDPYRNR